METQTRTYDGWIGHDAYDRNDNKIGEISEIYYDDVTGRPEWLAIRTGLFGMNTTFAPIAGATGRGEDLVLAYDKDLVKDAPNVAPEGALTADEERQLYAHYDFSWDDTDSSADYGYGDVYRDERPDVDFDEHRDDAMTRSEEQLRVGKERHESGRVRLRKYVVTDHEQVTVPVTREEVRVEREPITDENIDRALDGPEITENEFEVVTHEERPVVSKETVPKERVRLTKDVVTDEETVDADLRKEQIDVETGNDIANKRNRS